MKTISWLVLFALSCNVFASNGSLRGLEQALDEYQYAMTIDWDQRDSQQSKEMTDIFYKRLEQLINEENLTPQDITKLLEARISDSKTLNSLKAKLSLINFKSAASSSELAKIMSSHVAQFYTRGASWNGEAILGSMILLLPVFLLAYAVWFDSTHECVKREYSYGCEADGYTQNLGYGETRYVQTGVYCSDTTASACVEYARK